MVLDLAETLASVSTAIVFFQIGDDRDSQNCSPFNYGASNPFREVGGDPDRYEDDHAGQNGAFLISRIAMESRGLSRMERIKSSKVREFSVGNDATVSRYWTKRTRSYSHLIKRTISAWQHCRRLFLLGHFQFRQLI